MPVKVGEAQLGARVGVLAAADRPRAYRPGVEVDPAGQLAHLRAMADLAVAVDCWDPGRLGLGEDRLADVGVNRHAHREPHAALAQVPSELGASPGAVASDQDRLVTRGGGELREGEVDQLDQIIAGTSGGVAWPQDPSQRLTWGLAPVQVGQQRVEPNDPL